MADLPKDIPAPAQGIDPPTRGALDRHREALQVLLGFRGNRLDRAVTWRDLVEQGLASLGGTGAGSGGGSAPGTIALPGAQTEEPDLTPPPNVTGLAITAGLGHVIVQWDNPIYTQGHGHGQTNLYAVKKLSSDPSLPTFADAALTFEATGALTIAALPSDLGIRWHVWAKWQSKDGVESVDPAGGTNGVQATTGKIGNSDLGDAIVQARNLATQSASLLADQSFETWTTNEHRLTRLAGTDPAVPAGCPRDFAARFNDRDCIGPASTWITAFPGDQFLLTCYVNRSGAGVTDGGVVCYVFDAAGAVLTVFTHGVLTPGTPSSAWERVALTMQVPAGGVKIGVGPWISQPFGGLTTMWFAGLAVEKRIDAGLVTTNMIVAGSGAIGDAAIDNAAIADAAIDDAKIADLSAAKLTVGDGTVGGNLKSANYVAGSLGWLLRPDGFAEASNIVARGTIFASAGAIGGATISATDVRSTNYVAGVQGWQLANANGGQIGGVLFDNVKVYSSNYSTGSAGFAITRDGDVEFNSGTFRGALAAATGSFAGALSAATGTFAGDLSAAGGTFAGTLTAAAVNAVDTINLAGNAVTVPSSVSATSSVSAPSSGATTILTSASIDPKGGSVIIAASIDWTAAFDAGGEAGSATYLAPTFSILRGATSIAAWTPGIGFGGTRQCTSYVISDTPGAAATYTLTISGGNLGGGTTAATVTRRTMCFLGARR